MSSTPRFLALLALAVVCQTTLAQDVDARKYWVFFTDKPTVAAKAVPISERALERRARRSNRVSPTLDLSVSETYVERLKAMGAEPVVTSRWLNAVSARMSADMVDLVSGLPFVAEIRPVGVLQEPDAVASTAIPPFGLRPASGAGALRLDYGASFTQLSLVNAIDPLEEGINGQGVLLGIIDTGTGSLAHAAFSHIIHDGRLVAQQDFTGQADDFSRHGFSVLSVAAGFDEGNLIGPGHGASVILARTEYAPTETNQEEDNFVAGLEWMESQGVDVVNCSLGYSEFDPGQNSYTNADLDGDTGITTRAADMAAALGVVFVTSAGNEGDDPWLRITTPSDGDSVIAVGAVNSAGLVTGFSGRGPSADGRVKPDVSAMGSGVRVARTDGDYGTSGGTSFSSPMVAGIVAQMLQVNPNLGPIDVRDILTSTASQSNNPDSLVGYGIVDAAAAIAAAEVHISSTVPLDMVDRLGASVFPNPSSGPAQIELTLDTPGTVRIAVFDMLGRRVASSQWAGLSAGKHRLDVPLPRRVSGLYGYRITTGRGTAVGTLSVVR